MDSLCSFLGHQSQSRPRSVGWDGQGVWVKGRGDFFHSKPTNSYPALEVTDYKHSSSALLFKGLHEEMRLRPCPEWCRCPHHTLNIPFNNTVG